MLLAAATTIALAFQTIPESASVIYTGIPECAIDTSVEMRTHAATYTLSKDSVEMNSLTTLRNSGDKAITLKLYLPVRGKNVNWNQTEKYRISARLNKKSLALKQEQTQRTPPSESQREDGIWAASYSRSSFATVTFKPKETKSLEVKFTAPMGRAGLDKVQRMVVYDTAGGDNWSGSVGQFNYAIQYKPALVLQVYATLPEGIWEVGAHGAFVKKYGFTPAEKSLYIFTYYPGGFEPIGGGTTGG